MSMREGMTIVNCSRCGVPCKLADTATEDARLMRHATHPEMSGYCPECAVTDFFKHHSPLAQAMEMNPAGKQMLLDPRVQQQFAGLLQTGKADARPSDINWQRVFENWDLPFQKARKSRKK